MAKGFGSFAFSSSLEIISFFNCSWKITVRDPCPSCFEEQVHWGLKLPLDQCQGIQVRVISCWLGLLPWHHRWNTQGSTHPLLDLRVSSTGASFRSALHLQQQGMTTLISFYLELNPWTHLCFWVLHVIWLLFILYIHTVMFCTFSESSCGKMWAVSDVWLVNLNKSKALG